MKVNLKKVLIFTLIMLFSQTVYSTEAAEATEQTPSGETPDSADQTGSEETPAPEGGEAKSLDDSVIQGSELHLLHLPKCNKKMLNAFGFQGEPRGLEMELGMCPSVKHSCCKNEDQVTMYEMWIAAKGKDHLENKFKIQTGVDNHLNITNY